MLIAKEKKESNIFEYLLYMYQIEDIIRSFQFNLTMIDASIVQQFEQSEAVKMQIKDWYAGLIEQMKTQSIEQKGHLASLKVIIADLQGLHQLLLTTYQDQEYLKLYDAAKPELKALVLKSGGQNLSNEVDVALHGVYGLLVLRLKRQTISEQTEVAMSKITSFLAHLANRYHQRKDGKLKFSEEKKN
jgi:hypothetical protein